VDGIDADGGLVTQCQLGILAAQNPFGRDVPVGQAVEYQNVLIGTGEQDFIVYRVDGHLRCRARALIYVRPSRLPHFGPDLSFVSLDDAKRRFLSTGCSAEFVEGKSVKRTASTDFLERAMGIELYPLFPKPGA